LLPVSEAQTRNYQSQIKFFNAKKVFMSPLSLHILMALIPRDVTATQLREQVYEDVCGQMFIRERGFYAALERLARAGHLERYEALNGRAFYRLTRLGRRLLKIEQDRLARSARLLHERL
jgi:DNA-binding PadR family transcriptional regulator